MKNLFFVVGSVILLLCLLVKGDSNKEENLRRNAASRPPFKATIEATKVGNVWYTIDYNDTSGECGEYANRAFIPSLAVQKALNKLLHKAPKVNPLSDTVAIHGLRDEGCKVWRWPGDGGYPEPGDRIFYDEIAGIGYGYNNWLEPPHTELSKYYGLITKTTSDIGKWRAVELPSLWATGSLAFCSFDECQLINIYFKDAKEPCKKNKKCQYDEFHSRCSYLW